MTRHLLLTLVGFLLTSFASAATYEVGPGKPHAEVENVPWESIAPGDTVLIHWRAQPYASKFVLAVPATQSLPFVLRGVAGPAGELPVITGENAQTRTVLNFWNENRAVIKIGGSNNPPDATPAWITVENLDIRSARPPFQYFSPRGNGAYINNAASIYVEKGQNITIRNCVLRDSGNGLFVANQSSNVLVEGNWIYDNGNIGSIYEHNSYTEANGITFQFNRYGPLRTGCLGNNLKDRSAGTIVRYNWIESGNRQLDLVESGSASLINLPSYRSTFVYGNILIEPDGAGNSQIVHYGGDNGDTSTYRKGTLYFFNNTVVSTRSGNTTLMRLSTSGESADARNNIVSVTAAGSSLGMIDSEGALRMRNNWFKQGWVRSHGNASANVIDEGGTIAQAAPGFVDAAGQNFRLIASSSCINAGTANAAGASAHPVLREYQLHRGSTLRPSSGTMDLGAFEFGDSAPGAPTGFRLQP